LESQFNLNLIEFEETLKKNLMSLNKKI